MTRTASDQCVHYHPESGHCRTIAGSCPIERATCSPMYRYYRGQCAGMVECGYANKSQEAHA